MDRFLAAFVVATILSTGSTNSAHAQATAAQLDEIAKLSADQFDMQKDTFVEAREWLKDAKHQIANDKLKRDDVVKLVDDLYTAGALRVYFTAVMAEGDVQKAPAMMAIVGGQPAVRTKTFETVNAFVKTMASAAVKPELEEMLKVLDAGQPVITLTLSL